MTYTPPAAIIPSVTTALGPTLAAKVDTTDARLFSVTFRCLADNGVWQEIARTAVQT
jgi:hypothetical protein